MLTPDYEPPQRPEPKSWTPAQPVGPSHPGVKILADGITFAFLTMLTTVIVCGFLGSFGIGGGSVVCFMFMLLPIPGYVLLSRYRSDGFDTVLMKINTTLFGLITAFILVVVGLAFAFH